MLPTFEPIVVFVVMSVLVALFAWIYYRDRQREFGFWLLGWTAILIHFAVPLTGKLLSPSVADWVSAATLIVAANFFWLSVSEMFRKARHRAAFVLNIVVAALVYLTGVVFHFPSRWFYVVLLSTSVIATLIRAVRFYGFKSLHCYGLATLLLPYALWADWQAGNGRPGYGLDFYLFGYFCITAATYFRRFRTLSPGVIFTSLSFLAWGLVFPLNTYLHPHGYAWGLPHCAVWDLPQCAVAFGMILTLFENQTAVATTAATKYRTLFERNMAAVYVSTLEGRLLDCNSAFLQVYGFESKEEALATQTQTMYVEPLEREAFLDDLREHGQVLNSECRQRRRDGSLFWILERAATVTAPDGRTVIEGTFIDITERKQAELALKQSEERFAAIFRESPMGCVIVTLDGVLVNVNEAMLRVLARPAEMVVGRSAVELGLWQSQQVRDRFFSTLRVEGSVHNLETDFKDANGQHHEGLYSATLVRISDKQCILGFMTDLTEKRELEAKFRHAQKMESLGRLAGGVAHDFNNLLAVIGGYAELLESKLSDNETYRRYCASIIETTQRAGGLTQQLLTFSRKEATRPTPLQPDQALRELVAGMLPGLIGENIEMVLNLRAHGTVAMDKTNFVQIILNIAANARDAMPNGGQLFIETEDICRPLVLVSGSVAIKEYVAIRIRDTGVGMDKETQQRAFEPFYTTKGVGHGTGLGLYTVYGIVQQSNGEITIDSQPGQGTNFNILVPAIAEEDVGEHTGEWHEVAMGAGNILLVEDQAQLRNVSAEFLTSIGYSVICASSGPEALKLACEAGRIDLVISDVVMPKMNGREFADALLRERPSIKLLFVSGYADDVVLQTGLSTQAIPFLAKPFSLKQLASKVNEVLSPDTREHGYNSSRASSAG